MNDEKYLREIVFDMIKNHNIAYSEEGFEFLKREINSRLINPGYEVKIQPISEVSIEDRAQRKTPRIEIVLK